MQEFISISFLIVLAAISPGPDFAIVAKNAMMHSRRAGIFTAIGISTSLLVHAIYCVLGLAVIISQSLLAFRVIKYLGAAYLIYIGIKSLLAKRTINQSISSEKGSKSLSNLQAFSQGLLCNLLNPKAIMFLLAFFTLVVQPGQKLFLEIIYGLEISLIHLVWFSCLSFLLTHRHVKAHLNHAQFYIVKSMGLLLVAFGIRIAALKPTTELPEAF